jgi:hypothetical protein
VETALGTVLITSQIFRDAIPVLEMSYAYKCSSSNPQNAARIYVERMIRVARAVYGEGSYDVSAARKPRIAKGTGYAAGN